VTDKEEKYSPEYAKGQILVSWRAFPEVRGIQLNVDPDETAHALGEKLGYPLKAIENLSGKWYRKEEDEDYLPYAYVFQTEVGKEEEARKRFEEYPEFVEWTGRRDLKLERRGRDLEKIVDDAQVLLYDLEISDKIYDSRIDSLIDALKKLKSKKE